MMATISFLALAIAAAAPAMPAASGEATAATTETQQLYALVLTPGRTWKPGKPFSEQGLRDHFF